jgi:hypothetical protein
MSIQKGLAHESSSKPCHKITQLKNAALPSDSLDEALTVFSFSRSIYGIKWKKCGMQKQGKSNLRLLKPTKP